MAKGLIQEHYFQVNSGLSRNIKQPTPKGNGVPRDWEYASKTRHQIRIRETSKNT